MPRSDHPEGPLDGPSLRRRRVALGLTPGDVAGATAVPVEYVVAVEENDPRALPPGPYRQGYARTMARFLARAEETPDRAREVASQASDPMAFSGDRPTGPLPRADGSDGGMPTIPRVVTRAVPRGDARRTTGIPFTWVRALAVGAVGLLVVLLAYQGWRFAQQTTDLGVPEARVVAVNVSLRENATLRVVVDGRLVDDRLFAGGESMDYAGRRVEVDVPNLQVVRVAVDGRPVRPTGHQGRPRTLVFVQDEESE